MSSPRFTFPAVSPLPRNQRGSGLRVLSEEPEARSPLEVCDEMIADLDREIASSRAGLNDRAIHIASGGLAERRGPLRIYRLVAADALPPLGQEQAVLARFGDGTTLTAQVYSARERIVHVAFATEIDDAQWEKCRLVLDDLWMLERLRARLAQLRESLAKGLAPRDFNFELAQLAIGEGNFEHNATHTSVDVDDQLLDELNERQRDIVRAALCRRAAYVWGPPGTGKSTTLAALVHAHVVSGRRVLVVAPSNAAADVIAIALASRLATSSEFDRGLMLRAGPRPSRELQRRYGAMVVPQEIVQRLAAERFDRDRTTLEREITDIESFLTTELDAGARDNSRRRLAAARTALHRLDRDEMAFVERAFDDLFERCQVAVTPVHNIYLSKQVRGPFDVVVVDEASMVQLPQLYLAAGLAQHSVVIAGDFQQLPAPVVHRAPMEVPWLATDVFSRVGIPDDVAREDDPDYLLMLTEQYRMAPKICDLVSDLFYSGRLTTATEVKRRPVRGPREFGPLVLVDTGGLSPRANVPKGTHSRTNAAHVRLAKDLVPMLLNDEGSDVSSDLLVISPYSAQVQLLYSALAPERRRLGGRLRVSSIHRAQGAEAGTVIVAIDDAPGAPVSRFMAARDWRSPGSRLLNVAISRARDRVVMLADVAYLERAGGAVIRGVIAAMAERGQVIRADEMSVAVRA